jgi:hypothetical protein
MLWNRYHITIVESYHYEAQQPFPVAADCGADKGSPDHPERKADNPHRGKALR